MTLMKKLLLIFLFSAIASSCSNLPTDPDAELGFVVGSIGFKVDDANTLSMLREVYFSTVRESNSIFNAFNVRLKKEGKELRQIVSFSFPLKPDSYKIGQLRIYTAGNELIADNELPINFKVKKDSITYIGLLELQLESKEGLLMKVMNRQAMLANSMSQQEQDVQYHNEKYKDYTSFPVITSPVLQEPKKVLFINKDHVENSL